MQQEFNNNTCLGIVLAGGQSSRMGQDKAKLMRNDVDMLSYSKQLLNDAGISQVVISGNNHQVPDLIENGGPVAGIYSVLKRYQPSAILALPVDLPLMTSAALQQLKTTGELSQKACFFQGHNIPLYLPNNAFVELFMSQAFSGLNPPVKSAAMYTASDTAKNTKSGPSFRALLNQVPHTNISPEHSSHLFNTNTPEQWQQARARFR